MMVDAHEFSSDLEAGPTEGALARVTGLANRLVSLDAEIREQSTKLKKLEEERRLISEAELPEAMDSCGDSGILSLTLGTGSKVVVSTKYRCGQLDDTPDDPRRPDRKPMSERAAALEWLSEHGYGDLARRTITIILGKGSTEVEDKIRAFFNSLRLNSAQYIAASVVPWNTLSAFVRSAEVAGDEVPLEQLGVAKVRVAEVKKAKRGDQLEQ